MTRQRDYISTFEVGLYKHGENKDRVIQALVELGWFSLDEATDLMNHLPKLISDCLSREEAERAVRALQEAGAVAEMDRCIDLD